MATGFCCPSCGTSLRVNPATALLISCPCCGEAIRVPRLPHPVESISTASLLSAERLTSVAAGLRRLKLSLICTATALSFGLFALAAKVLFVQPHQETNPALVLVFIAASTGWTLCAGVACWLRYRGYLDCKPAASAVGVDGWVTASLWGTLFSLLGVVAVGPCLIGRPFLVLPTVWLALVLIGLACGVFGLLLEFAFLSALHRFFWEQAGWELANRTGQYAVNFVFGVIGAMGCLCIGGMMLVLLAGGQAGLGDGTERKLILPAESRAIGLIVLAGVAGSFAWLCWRYHALLQTMRLVITPRLSTPAAIPVDRTPQQDQA